jgi:hypothetical protein
MNEEDSVSDDNSSKHSNSVSNDSSSYAPSGSNSSTNRGSIPERILASRETRNVKYSRIMVLTVLFLAATIAGVMTWYWSKEAEQGNFDTQVSETCMQFSIDVDCFSNILTFDVSSLAILR